MRSAQYTQIRDYIDFIDLQRHDIAIAIEAWDFLRPNLHEALANFYQSRIVKYTSAGLPEFDTETLIEKQIEYWEIMFCGGMDESYAENVKTVGKRHRELGVPLPHYIMSYGLILDEFERILHRYYPNQAKHMAAITAIRKFFLLDMSIASSAYDPAA